MMIGNGEKLTSFQVIMLVVTCRLLINYAFTPAFNLPPGNQDAWIIDVLSGVYILVMYLPVLFLSNRFRGIPPAQYFEILLGKYLGKFAGFMISLYLLFFAFFFSVIFIDFIKSSVLTTTPVYAILILLLVIAAYAAYIGLDSIIRAAELLIIFIMFIIIAFTVLNFNNFDMQAFLPILHDSNIFQLNLSAISLAGRFCDGVMFMVIIAYMDKKYSVNKTFITTLLLFSSFAVLLTVTTEAVLGADYAKRLNFPYYTTTQQINLFDFIQRIEFVNVIGWIFGFMIKISSFIAASSLVMRDTLKTKSNQIFIIPMSILIMVFILMTDITKNAVYRKIIYVYAPYLVSAFTYAFPLILVIVYFFRRKKLKAYGK